MLNVVCLPMSSPVFYELISNNPTIFGKDGKPDFWIKYESTIVNMRQYASICRSQLHHDPVQGKGTKYNAQVSRKIKILWYCYLVTWRILLWIEIARHSWVQVVKTTKSPPKVTIVGTRIVGFRPYGGRFFRYVQRLRNRPSVGSFVYPSALEGERVRNLSSSRAR